MDQNLEQVSGVHHRASLAARAGNGQEVMVQYEKS